LTTGPRYPKPDTRTPIPVARFPNPDTLNPFANCIILGVDDTDSPRGLCTTYLATRLVDEFSDFDLIGFPRLVRLNPNIPWKTRGNGAISLAFGMGAGRRFRVGKFEDMDVKAYPRASPARIDLGDFLERADRTVLENSARGEKRTNPAVFAALRRPPERLYLDAVSRLVRPSEVVRVLAPGRGRTWDWRTHRGSRGIVGASAAAAWRGRRRTFELIAYRQRDRWGTPRDVDFDSVARMDRIFTGTFNNIDERNRHIVIAPHSPCPVLFGVRAFWPGRLEDAAGAVEAHERPARTLLFSTNQGTDDHLRMMAISNVRPYMSPVIAGTVSAAPRTERGGHVFFRISDATGSIACAAFEPTKEFRDVVRRLIVGDSIEASGGVHKRPFTLNLEKLAVRALAASSVRKKPRCPSCGRMMKSAGSGAGFRCRRCRTRAGPGAAMSEPMRRDISTKIHEVPKCARRHLSRPISR
jgi:tRNA(Ile2)-agmatinylcytidine synthase